MFGALGPSEVRSIETTSTFTGSTQPRAINARRLSVHKYSQLSIAMWSFI